MAKFNLPVEWAVCALVEIEADTIEKAVEIFNETIDDIPLPTDNNYIDDSFKLGSQETGNIEDDIKYYKCFNDEDNEFETYTEIEQRMSELEIKLDEEYKTGETVWASNLECEYEELEKELIKLEKRRSKNV